MMNKTKICILGLLATAFGFQSCLDDNNDDPTIHPNALVTVKSDDNGKTFFQLDEKTTLFPENVTTKLFDGKEVRALINYAELEKETPGFSKTIKVNWIDSIRTKEMDVVTPEKPLDSYGNDPLEIMNDWVTIAEDGYLTLRIRTNWSVPTNPHYLYLVGNVDSENPFVVELRHDAKGDTYGPLADALIAFRLSHLPEDAPADQKLTVKWNSPSGMKKADFDLHATSQVLQGYPCGTVTTLK